jgi:uncharacterized protein (DUF58 family)
MPSRLAIALLLILCPAGFLAGELGHGWLVLLVLDAGLLLLVAVDWVLAGKLKGLLGAERLCGRTVSAGRTERVSLRLWSNAGRRITAAVAEALPAVARPDQVLFRRVRLESGRHTDLHYGFTAAERGTWPVGPAVVRVLGPLGMAWRQFELLGPTSIKVYPDMKPMGRYETLLRQSRLRDVGLSPTAPRGQGTDFESLREFVAGDDPGRLEWKATARRGRLIVKNFQAERSQTVTLLIDSGKMMTTIIEGKSRLDYAVDSALLLSHVIISRGDRAGLVLFSDKIKKLLPPARDAGQIRRIAEALHDAGASLIEPDYLRAMRAATSQRKRSLIIIYTDIWGREIAGELVQAVRNIMPAHLPLIVMMRDRDMEALAEGRSPEGRSPEGVYETSFHMAAACRLLQERGETIARLRAMGAVVLDVYPGQLTAGTIRKYLEVKMRNLI